MIAELNLPGNPPSVLPPLYPLSLPYPLRKQTFVYRSASVGGVAAHRFVAATACLLHSQKRALRCDLFRGRAVGGCTGRAGRGARRMTRLSGGVSARVCPRAES